MKFALAFTALATAVLSVEAAALDTNAQRLARGLPPKTPSRRFTPSPAHAAKRTQPSGTPSNSGSCNTGPMQCCNSVQESNSPGIGGILGLLGINLSDVTGLLGFGCSPITAVGVGGGGSCNAHPVCCEDNSRGGLISIGCIPITL
ncbi:hypothetical protein JAAARDRAFT_36124 [Jaapia argillacea MUCL 33604]|uniref:Hydrophobin n=1 Tax=Jaapia argillacea MUCL 33604 TaxID=933084 RepID=A0A067PPD7_9AGAM|nr:hypothetical protein JAAARDRAFT_36124 [Jaapia argillacea MUCL 33604]